MTRIPFMRIESTRSCRACGVTTHVYRRYLHGEMLHFLFHLAAHGGWARSREILNNAGPKASTDGSYLVHWGFVEKRKRGEYRATAAGRQFLRGYLMAPAYIRMRDGKLLGTSKETIDVTEIARRG